MPARGSRSPGCLPRSSRIPGRVHGGGHGCGMPCFGRGHRAAAAVARPSGGQRPVPGRHPGSGSSGERVPAPRRRPGRHRLGCCRHRRPGTPAGSCGGWIVGASAPSLSNMKKYNMESIRKGGENPNFRGGISIGGGGGSCPGLLVSAGKTRAAANLGSGCGSCSMSLSWGIRTPSAVIRSGGIRRRPYPVPPAR